MRKPVLMTLIVAGMLMAGLSFSVRAQEAAADTTTPPGATVAQIEPITATVRQQLPLSITLRLPLGATDTQTVTVPILLNIQLQIALGDLVSPALDLSATVSTLVTATNASTSTAAAVAAATPAATATVPPTPVPATPTAVPATTPTATPLTATATLTITGEVTTTPATTATVVLAPDCPDPRARITSPGNGQVLAGTVPILGSAAHEDFQYYKLEYTPGTDGGAGAEYFYFDGGESRVENGELGLFATQPLANGPYVLRLTVVDNTGNFPTPCTVAVEVAN